MAIVLAMIFIGARVGGIGLGIYGMIGVLILVFGFGMHPGKVPIDVMLIIVSVITATAALQAAGGLEFYPLKNSNLHFFLTYVGRHYSYTDKAKAFGFDDYSTNRISLGYIWQLPMF